MSDEENSIEYIVYGEKEIRYKERYKIKRQVAGYRLRCKIQDESASVAKASSRRPCININAI